MFFVFLAKQLVQRVSCFCKCAVLCIHDAHSASTQTYMHRHFYEAMFCSAPSLCVLPLLCSLFFLFKRWVLLPVDQRTFMQPDTGSCFILDANPLTPSSSPKHPVLCSSVCTLPSGCLGKSTNMLNRARFQTFISLDLFRFAFSDMYPCI